THRVQRPREAFRPYLRRRRLSAATRRLGRSWPSAACSLRRFSSLYSTWADRPRSVDDAIVSESAPTYSRSDVHDERASAHAAAAWARAVDRAAPRSRAADGGSASGGCRDWERARRRSLQGQRGEQAPGDLDSSGTSRRARFLARPCADRPGASKKKYRRDRNQFACATPSTLSNRLGVAGRDRALSPLFADGSRARPRRIQRDARTRRHHGEGSGSRESEAE